MSKPKNLATKIFLDSGDPEDTRQAVQLLGFLDGQTTNPSLISKNPEAQERLTQGKKFNAEELLGFYKDVIKDIARIIPKGSISVEVYADNTTTAQEMILQGTQMVEWTSHAQIKLPINEAGLQAASQLVANGIGVNMTLCFSQAQAAAVYNATQGAKRGQVYISPFIGRLDDKGHFGLDLIKHLMEMYSKSDGHVEVLAASVRSLEHFVACIELGADIITAPLSILQEWSDAGGPTRLISEYPNSQLLHPISFEDHSLEKNWQDVDIGHELTSIGLEKFASDWNTLIVASSL